jgi:hypothetical protein
LSLTPDGLEVEGFMPAENVCPHCGAPLADWGDAVPVEGKPHADAPIEGEEEAPPVELLASGSNDETFLANPHGHLLVSAEPDPILGNFVTPSSREFPESSAATAGRAGRSHSKRRSGPEPVPTFPSLNFDGASSKAVRGAARQDDEEDEQPERRNTWVSILLVSYASAITLALGWTLWRTPRVRETPAEAPAAETPPTVGRQAGLSRKVGLPEPVISEHLLALKKPLQVGSLEVTPLEVRRERVALQRTSFSGKVDRRDGGKNALVLRLKLRNTSKDEVFAPLDQAFLREQEKKLVDSFLETGAGERVYPFPLAVESEWSIIGQEFGELRPGETRVVTIVSAPEAPGDEAGPFTWRVRLRTGIDRTDVIGVRWPEPGAGRPK